MLNGQRPNDVHVFEEFAGEELQVDVGTIRYGEVSQAISKMKKKQIARGGSYHGRDAQSNPGGFRCRKTSRPIVYGLGL